jgi:hypothetical protein
MVSGLILRKLGPLSGIPYRSRGFIGLAGYYRKHVRNLAELAKPLNNLTRKEVPFGWTEEHQKAFEELKPHLSTEPLLIIRISRSRL